MTRTKSLALAVAFTMLAQLPPAVDARAQMPPATPPAHWGPVSINLEDVPYPHPVSFLDQELFGQMVRLAYMDVAPLGQANGRTVALLHGGTYYGWYWKDTIEALRGEGYRVVVIDRLGWGRSSKPILPYSINLHAANTRAVLDHLGIAEVAIVGHSIGGQEASRYAFLYPETTTHFVMVNPVGLTDAREGRAFDAPEWGETPADLQRVYESIVRRETNRYVTWKPQFIEHVRIAYGQYLSGEWPRLSYVRGLAGAARSVDTVVHDWPQMETKGMLIGGAQDGPSFPAQARAAVDAMQNAELVLFPDAGHNPHEELPERFNAELIRFLATDPDTPAGGERLARARARILAPPNRTPTHWSPTDENALRGRRRGRLRGRGHACGRAGPDTDVRPRAHGCAEPAAGGAVVPRPHRGRVGGRTR